jgi:hypothetical protein
MSATLFGSARLSLILQTAVAGCGLACLAMVACHHGLRTARSTMRARFVGSLGLQLRDADRQASNRSSCRPSPLRSRSTTVPTFASSTSGVRCEGARHAGYGYVVLNGDVQNGASPPSSPQGA